MTTYRQIFYHLIFRTKDSRNTLSETHSRDLYNYLWGIIKNHNSKLYQANGTENHIHLLLDLHPSFALADFMRELKSSSSRWMKESGKFPAFIGWAEGYGAFTIGQERKESLIQYIKNQREHHRQISFE